MGTSLLDFYSSIMEYNKKLDDYTMAKCAYERNMETCILEQLYYTNRTKLVIASLKEKRNQCHSKIYEEISNAKVNPKQQDVDY